MHNNTQALAKYYKNRSKPHEGYQEQVLGKKKIKEMGKLWKEHGETLEYIREILEYQFILDFYPNKEQKQLIVDIFQKQNIFLKDCYAKILMKEELEKALAVSENNM